MELNSQAIFSNPTTGFLTATTFIYALGAGITAAAGTRLALQLILISVSGYSPLQSLTHVCASKLLFFVAASPGIGIGQFARLLLTVVMVAISQAPSPESNPNSPLPVKGKVVNYTTFNLIGGKFVQQRVHADAFATFACLNSSSCRKIGVGFCFGEAHLEPQKGNRGHLPVLKVRGSSYRY
jgi:hypothetical protein